MGVLLLLVKSIDKFNPMTLEKYVDLCVFNWCIFLLSLSVSARTIFFWYILVLSEGLWVIGGKRSA